MKKIKVIQTVQDYMQIKIMGYHNILAITVDKGSI